MITFTGTLLNLDGVPDDQGDLFDENTAVSLPSRNVLVSFDFQERPEFILGVAKLYFRPNKVCYKMELDETKLPKYALEGLFPCVDGYYNRKLGISIEGIALSPSRNADQRIKPIGEQK